jgi:hypothetical protein
MYAGLFGGTADNSRAARIAATIAITACLRFGSATDDITFAFASLCKRYYYSSCQRTHALFDGSAKVAPFLTNPLALIGFVLPNPAVGVCGAGF